MVEQLSPEFKEIQKDFERAKDLCGEGHLIEALEVTEDLIVAHVGNSSASGMNYFLEGIIFYRHATKTENRSVKCAYLLSAVESFYAASCLLPGYLKAFNFLVCLLLELGDHLVSKKFYKLAVQVADMVLSSETPRDSADERKELETKMKDAKTRIHRVAKGTLDDFGTVVEENKPKLGLTRKSQGQAETRNEAVAEILRPVWAEMTVERKRGIMKISIEKLKSFVEKLYDKEGREALERGLEFAWESKKWKLWKCRSCSKEFHRPAECKKHLENEHAAKFGLYPNSVFPQNLMPKVDEVWADKITVVEWKPVDTVAAVRMIKTRLADVKEFVYVQGWSKDWPSVNDEERSKLLGGIRSLLTFLVERKILSCSVKEWVVNCVVKHLGVSINSLEDCSLACTPQCICFLEHHGLQEVFGFLGRFNFFPFDTSTDLVFEAVDGFLGCSRVKERISFDDKFSCLLLDRRLLTGKIKDSDNEGIADVISSNIDHYARVSPQGNEIVNWALDCPLTDNKFEFRRPIRAHNLGNWLAVLRILQFKCRILRSKYKKKNALLYYDVALIAAKKLLVSEDERRKNIPEDQWKTYAMILRDKCAEHVKFDAVKFPEVEMFLAAVRDVLEEANQLRCIDFKLEDLMNSISKHSYVDDDDVYFSLSILQTVVSAKIPSIDSKILHIDDSMKRLLSHLTELSVFDYRSYIIQMLKSFLRKELEEARSAIAAVNLLKEIDGEEKKNKKKKKKMKKKSLVLESRMNNNKSCGKEEEDNKGLEAPNSLCFSQTFWALKFKLYDRMVSMALKGTTGTSSPRDQTVEPETSVTTESQLEPADHASIDHATEKTYLEDKLTSETAALKVSANDHKETTTEKTQHEDQLSSETGAFKVSDNDHKETTTEKTQLEDQLSSETGAFKVSDNDHKETTTERTYPEDQLSSETGAFKVSDNDHKETTTEKTQLEDQLSSETGAFKVSDNDHKETTTERTYPEDKLSSETGASKVSDNDHKETTTEDTQMKPQDKPLENKELSDLESDSRLKDEELSTQLMAEPTKEAIRYNSVVDMMLKALWNINIFRKEIQRSHQPVHNHNHLEERCIPCALQDLFFSFVSKQTNDEELYPYLLNELIASLEDAQSMESDAAELLISVLEFLRYWKSPKHRESLVTRLFTLEEFERMSCSRCTREPNYLERSSYGLNICADSIRKFKSAYGYMKFEDILEAIRMNFQMYCDKKAGGCGNLFYVRHDITRCPAIFVIALEWEKNETREEICATVKALETGLDISVLYKGINPMTNYKLVTMIGCSGKEEYSCIAYENDRWVRHDPSVKEDIGNWNNVIRFCSEREVRPEILFFEATWWPKKP